MPTVWMTKRKKRLKLLVKNMMVGLEATTHSLYSICLSIKIYKEISPSKKHDGRFRSNNTLTIRRARNLGCV